MKTEIRNPDWEDIVFESRHKEYGAYAIRKSYEENVAKASMLAIMFAALLFAAIQVAMLLHVEIKISHADLPTVLQPPPRIIAKYPFKKVVTRTSPEVNRDLQISVVSHEVESRPVKPTETTFAGTETGPPLRLPVEGKDLGNGKREVPAVVDPPKILVFAEVMPQYSGGMSAMLKFLHKNLHYPASARFIDQEGTVYVQFVVNNAGQVVDVEVVKGVNADLDREAMRIVALMKKWKPGKQHDVPVNVRMVLPIKFQLEQ